MEEEIPSGTKWGVGWSSTPLTQLKPILKGKTPFPFYIIPN